MPTVLDPLQRSNLNHWRVAEGWLFLMDPTGQVSHFSYLKKETDPNSETSRFLARQNSGR
jgi:hypothetical protein